MSPKLKDHLAALLASTEDEPDLPENCVIASLEDVEAVAWGLEQLLHLPPARAEHRAHEIAGLLQSCEVEDDAARNALRSLVLPRLLEVDAHLALSGEDEVQRCRMFLLKQIAYFGVESAVSRIIEAARAGYNAEGYMWSVILRPFSLEHPLHRELFIGLGEPPPGGFIGVSLLDAANAALIAGADFPHPFGGPEGVKRLRAWLRDLDPESFSYAHSATAALPFIPEPFRTELLELAMDHPDTGVSMEAGWACGKIGSERGIRRLADYATRVNTSKTALRYLEELGREDAIPPVAREPDFQATAEMAEWLAHPNEFGEPPESLELYDTRELFWPPTNDRRQVWLFKYRYPKTEDREEEDVGLGMVGSVTFALFGEVTADLSPLDAYALHCCWELGANEDERAPGERSVSAGREILGRHNDLTTF